MRRLFRWVVYVLIGLLVILILAYSAGQYYKPGILKAINDKVKGSIRGEFHLGSLDFTIFDRFPNVSIKLSDIYLRGPRYNTYKKDFFHARDIYVHVNPLHLLRGVVDLSSITIRGGELYIFRTRDGYSNLDAFRAEQPDTTRRETPHEGAIDLEKVLLEDTRITYVDSLKKKKYDISFVKTTISSLLTDTSRQVQVNGRINFGGLVFNPDKGGYLTDIGTEASLAIEIHPQKKQLLIRPSSLTFARSRVDLSGIVDMGAPGRLRLNINSEKLEYAEGLTIVTRALRDKLSKLQFTAPLKLTVVLDGQLAAGAEPNLDISFSTSGNQVSVGKLKFDNLSMKGCFMNHLDPTRPSDDWNSRVVLDTLSTTYNGIPTQARLSLTNLKDPELLLLSKAHVNLADLQQESDSSRLKLLGGDFEANVFYNGKLKEYMDRSLTRYSGILRGSIHLTDGHIELVRQQKKFEKVQVNIRFTENQMDLDQIAFNFNDNPITLKGSVKGFIPFFLVPEKKGFVRLSLYSPRLDLATLTGTKKVRPRPTIAKRKPVSDLIDLLDQKVEFLVDLKVDKLSKGSFRASDLSGKINLASGKFSADPITWNMAGGSMKVAIRASGLDRPETDLTVKAKVIDADIAKFLAAFDNFKSKITPGSIQGKIRADVDFRAQLDEQLKLQIPTLQGQVDLRVRDGELVNFAPLQNLSNFLFKKRDFTDVEFAEIIGHFRMRGQEVDVGRMEVQSSVMTMFLQGRYSLADSTDLSIQVPLSNLKKRDKDYHPENVGPDAKVGASVFLRAHQKDGKIVISYDPLKKFKKK